MASELDKRIDELVKIGKPKIAFGLADPNKEILESLKRAKKYADIILVGSDPIKDVDGFDKDISQQPEKRIIDMLINNEVEGIIRGTIDDFVAYEYYQELTGKQSTASGLMLQTANGYQFFLPLESNIVGWDRDDKLNRVLVIAKFLQDFGVAPKVAVLAGARHETYARKKDVKDGITGMLNKTYEEADWLVEQIKKKDIEVKNYSVDSGQAIIDGNNIIMAVNGLVSNQMMRMVLATGGKMLAGTKIGVPHFYEENSRSERDFEFHVKWIVAMINSKK